MLLLCRILHGKTDDVQGQDIRCERPTKKVKFMKCYLVAGELSGDLLGAELIKALREHFPQIECRGLGGPRMQAEGLTSLYPLETLSVMGLFEVLRHLPRLFRVRRHLYQDALEWQADIMIGIDAPDFNLGLEKRLHRKGMKTVHYVSPSVWAWRQGRVKTMAKAVDLVMTFLPFEAAFYREHQVPVAYVGHPLADTLPLEPDRQQARRDFGLTEQQTVLAILPGSRRSEVEFLLPDFLEAARLLRAAFPDIHFLMPAATPERKAQIQQHLEEFAELNLTLTDGQASQCMTAANVVLLASGTATLEAMLLKRPMVAAYRFAPLTYALGRHFVKTPFFSLPNLLAGEALVPELLQDEVTPMALAHRVADYLNDADKVQKLQAKFTAFHVTLKQDASRKAAEAIKQRVAPQ